MIPHKSLLTLLLISIGSLSLAAQSGFHIGPLFGNRYQNRKDATEVLLRGKRVKPYKLTLFRSLTLQPQGREATTLEQLVLKDGQTAIDKEVSLRNGHVYYAFYQLPMAKGQKRYLFFRNNALAPTRSQKADLTLIYMEGSATLSELKQYFKK